MLQRQVSSDCSIRDDINVQIDNYRDDDGDGKLKKNNTKTLQQQQQQQQKQQQQHQQQPPPSSVTIKEPKFHNILASCITGKVDNNNVKRKNDVNRV